MTREEEIKYASKDYVNYLLDKQEYHNENYTEDDIRQAFGKGAKWADSHSKSPWISTDKYLPKQGGHYLCNDGYNHISMLAFCGDKWVNSRTFDDIPLDSVKYWMFPPRLPE